MIGDAGIGTGIGDAGTGVATCGDMGTGIDIGDDSGISVGDAGSGSDNDTLVCCSKLQELQQSSRLTLL